MQSMEMELTAFRQDHTSNEGKYTSLSKELEIKTWELQMAEEDKLRHLEENSWEKADHEIAMKAE